MLSRGQITLPLPPPLNESHLKFAHDNPPSASTLRRKHSLSLLNCCSLVSILEAFLMLVACSLINSRASLVDEVGFAVLAFGKLQADVFNRHGGCCLVSSHEACPTTEAPVQVPVAHLWRGSLSGECLTHLQFFVIRVILSQTRMGLLDANKVQVEQHWPPQSSSRWQALVALRLCWEAMATLPTA